MARSIVSGLAANYYQARQSLEVERQKQQHELVVKMISTDDRQQAAQNLKFLVDLGLISDPDGKIARIVAEPSTGPVLSIEGLLPTGSAGSILRSLPDDVAELTSIPHKDLPASLQTILLHSDLGIQARIDRQESV